MEEVSKTTIRYPIIADPDKKVAELGGAHGGVVGRVAEEDRPAVAPPVQE